MGDLTLPYICLGQAVIGSPPRPTHPRGNPEPSTKELKKLWSQPPFRRLPAFNSAPQRWKSLGDPTLRGGAMQFSAARLQNNAGCYTSDVAL